ncbi:DDE superendonuclease family protein [Mycobacterium kansasii 732]|nr:DDE superendonuclease family protein [Mycobacterium kansasii 732]
MSALVEAATAACSVFVMTTELASVAAAHSVDPDRWQTEFSAVIDRIAPRFARYEPLRHAGELMAGMVSGLDRKNCWTITEHRGAATPDGLQHLLARASWDADAVRDDLRDYVIDAFGDRGAILVVDETGDVKKGHCDGRGATSVQRYGWADREFSSGGVSDLRRPARTRPDRPGTVATQVVERGHRPVCRCRNPRG